MSPQPGTFPTATARWCAAEGMMKAHARLDQTRARRQCPIVGAT